MPLGARMKKLIVVLVVLVALPIVGALVLLVVIPFAIKLTAKRVHADAGSVPANVAPVDPRWAPAADETARLARALVAADNLPGLSVAVGVDGRLAWAGGFGWADVDGKRPVTPDTRFRVGNVSKPLAAAGVGLLVMRGKLDLDAPVQRYVPTFPQKTTPITTRQLMAHTAGIRHHHGEREILSKRHCDNLGQAVAAFADDPLKFAAGTDRAYSTYGWVLVSAVVESAAGMPWADYLAREVFAPLGMNATVPDDARRPLPAQALFYYPRARADTQYGLEHPDPVDYSCFAGAGVYQSTPSDLVRFGQAMDRHELLDAKTTALLQTPVKVPGGGSNAAANGYALGWFVRDIPFRDGKAVVIGHRGQAAGGTTVFERYPEYGVVVAVSSNVTFAKLEPFASQVAAMFAPQAPGRPGPRLDAQTHHLPPVERENVGSQ